MKILFVNTCIRNTCSRTWDLADTLLQELRKKYSQSEVQSVLLPEENIPCLNADMLEQRIALTEKGDLSHPMFRYAHDFADADIIVVAAPYWDLSFPAMLKNYLEQVTANKVTFCYEEGGRPQGLCKAKTLYYVTTSGGYIGDMNFGYDYIKGLCHLYGIGENCCISAEGLDIQGNDTEGILREAKEQICQIL